MDDPALRPNALEQKYAGRSALRASNQLQLIAGAAVLAVVAGICCVFGIAMLVLPLPG